MRALMIVALLGGVAAAEPRKDMGKWDCKGTKDKPVEMTFQPGEQQTLVWKGECNGAEGYNVSIRPEKSGLVTKETHDLKAKEIVLELKNPTKAPITVKLYVFVGFA